MQRKPTEADWGPAPHQEPTEWKGHVPDPGEDIEIIETGNTLHTEDPQGPTEVTPQGGACRPEEETEDGQEGQVLVHHHLTVMGIPGIV